MSEENLIDEIVGMPEEPADTTEEPKAAEGEPSNEGGTGTPDSGEDPKAEAAEPEGDKKAEGDEDEAGEEKEVQRVPLPELMKARQKAREVEEANIQLRAQLEANQAMQQQLRDWYAQQQAQPQAKQEDEEIPDYNDDPLGHLQAVVSRQQKVLDEQRQAAEQASQIHAQQAQQQQARQQAVALISQYEDAFVADHEDYGAALNHVREVQRANMANLGYHPQQIEQVLLDQEIATGVQAIQNGINPAQYVYDIALRYGYTPDSADAGDKASTDGQGQSADEAKMDALEKGVKAQGGAEGAPPNLKDMAEMPENEFEEVLQSMFGSGVH